MVTFKLVIIASYILSIFNTYLCLKQWLFPIRELGMNSESQPLTENEAKMMRSSDEIAQRLIKSYQLMLDFYGIELVNAKTGQLKRNEKNYERRFAHLNRSFHNYLRITRICKCLGIMGFEHFKEQLLKFFVYEAFEHRTLTAVQESLVRFWIPTCRNEAKVKELDQLIQKLTSNKRIVDRNGRDGYGDEEGVHNWATKLYPMNSICKQ